MYENQYIGRGEELTSKIIERLYGKITILPQYPLEKLISIPEFEALDPEVQKHKFDFVMIMKRHYDIMGGWVDETFQIIIEVNYKHGEKLAKKYNNIFKPLLHKPKDLQFFVTVDDWDCRSLFKLNSKKHHTLTWDDFRDVIDSLEKAGVKP